MVLIFSVFCMTSHNLQGAANALTDLTGTVDDVSSFMQQARVALVPERHGGGFKLKLGYKYSRYLAVEGEFSDFTRPGDVDGQSSRLGQSGSTTLLVTSASLASIAVSPDAATIAFGVASSMRLASSRAANPPKTTECTAPSRAQASIATTACGIIGR